MLPMASGQTSPVLVIHEHYDDTTHEHDVALIKLVSETQGRVIPLADASLKIPPGQPLAVTGWGATAEGGAISQILLKGTVPYADNAACNGPIAYGGKIKSGMMCAEYRDGGADSCQGDSGGPLVCRRANKGPILVGVVPWGRGCARPLGYGVYTRVSQYKGWIERVIAQRN